MYESHVKPEKLVLPIWQRLWQKIMRRQPSSSWSWRPSSAWLLTTCWSSRTCRIELRPDSQGNAGLW